MTVSFKTFGCRLNRAETAQFEAGFAAAGFVRVPFDAPADIVVLHTCAVTQAAEKECLKLLRSLRAKKPDSVVVLAGCAVEVIQPDTLRALGADLIVPRDQKDELVSRVQRHLGVPCVSRPTTVPVRSTKRASLKIQDGCDFFCSYCIVPHTRGQPSSRPFDACLHDAQAFIDAGFEEIVVTGCNIACYRDGTHALVGLLTALAALPGLGRLRLGSIEPGTVEREVTARMAANPLFCQFLHLPIQSGDDAVLARMGRRYRAGEMEETLRDALQLMPNLGLGADIITGFPGESEEAFEQTRALLEAFPFSNLHVFPYSERPGTPAATFTPVVPEAERKRRASELNRLKARKRDAFARAFIGKPVQVLVEGIDPSGFAHGWTGEYLDCRISGVPATQRSRLIYCVPHTAEKGTLFACFPSRQPVASATLATGWRARVKRIFRLHPLLIL